jgi:hypothetical protein
MDSRLRLPFNPPWPSESAAFTGKKLLLGQEGTPAKTVDEPPSRPQVEDPDSAHGEQMHEIIDLATS